MATRIVLGNLTIDGLVYDAWVRDRRAGLTFLEYELLVELARHAGKVVSQQHLVEKLWPGALAGNSRKLTVHVSRLRRKIEGCEPWLIRTVKKRGYMMFLADRADQSSSIGHMTVTQA